MVGGFLRIGTGIENRTKPLNRFAGVARDGENLILPLQFFGPTSATVNLNTDKDLLDS